MPTNLIAMACSATKRSDPPALMPAIDRYDGPMWKTLRAALAELPEDKRPEVWFLSARYGFHRADLPIANYNSLMTEARARDLLRMPSSNRHGFADAVKEADKVLYCGGKLYTNTMEAAGLVRVHSTTWGGIGDQRKQLRAWIKEHCA